VQVVIETAEFDPWAALQVYQLGLPSGSFGATAVFVGSMRDFNAGDAVTNMSLEHYPGMTERSLQEILDQASARWPILDGLIHHRVGDIHPAEPIVLIAIWSAHRAAAFDASRFVMEELKSRAPFWKCETLDDGKQRWVAENTSGSSD